MIKNDKNLLILDIEATNTFLEGGGIYEVSAEVWQKGELVDTITVQCRPHVNATLTYFPNRARKYYLSNEDGFNTFRKFLMKYVKPFKKNKNPDDKFTVITWNATYDEDILRGWFSMWSKAHLSNYFNMPFYCAMRSVTRDLSLKNIKYKSYKLSEIAKLYDIPVNPSKLHSSAYDVELLRKILLKNGRKTVKKARTNSSKSRKTSTSTKKRSGVSRISRRKL